MATAPAPAAPTPDSKPKGIPDIMRGIGNMLRIAILEYNYKASQNELKKVLQEISGLKSDNANLGADVNRLTGELKNANIAQTRNFNILNADYTSRLRNANTGFREQLQDFQNRNAQLEQQLQDTQQNIADLARENGNLQAQLAPLQQQLQQVQQQNQQQLQQIQQQLKQARDETAAARTQAQSAAQQAQAEVDAARTQAAAAEQRVQQAEQRAQEAERARDAAQQAQAEVDAAAQRAQDAERAQAEAQARVAELETQLGELQTQQGASGAQVQNLQTQLEMARAAERAAEARANQAQAEAQTAARAAADEVQTANQARAAAEADVAAANQAREAAQQERDTALGRIGHAEEQARLATIRAAESAVQVRNLQTQLAQQGLSQQQVATLNQQLQDAVQKADADKAAAEETNRTLEQQLDQQMQDAQAAAQKAANEQQELAAELEGLRQQASATGNQNTTLQQQIAEAQKRLDDANANAEQRQREVDDAQRQFQTQLEQVQTAANAQVEAAQQRVQELEDALAAQGNDNTARREELQAQLQQQREAAQRAEEQAKAAQRAQQEAEIARTQQKVANRFMSAALKIKANTAADKAARARQEAEAARTASAEQVAAANAEAEARVAKQQSELDALREKLQTAESKGQEVGSLKQQLAAKERELEAQKLAQAAEVKAAEEKAEAARAEAAQQVAAAEAAKKAAEAAKTESENIKNTLLERHGKSVDVLNESNEENKKLKSELDELKKKLVELTAAKEDEKQLQQETDRTEKQQKFTVDKAALQARVTDAISKIDKMTDAKCKEQLLTIAKQIKIEVNELTLETFTGKTGKTSDLDKKVQNLSEATGDKIKTFVSMRKEDNPYNITFDETKKTVTTTTPAIAGGGPTKVWGPFSGVFDPESSNQAKYQSMKTDLLDDIPSKGTTVVIFGYGYSGSGKTYTLLGGINKETKRWEDGIAQLAIQGYIAAKCTVQMEEVFEMYNDSYTFDNILKKFVYNQSTSHKHTFKPVKLEDINTFKTKYSEIQRDRIKQSHILPTPNNRESSRGHLFIVLKVTNGETEGRLIICDMGGRENPNEMWMTAQYYKGVKPGTTVNVILGPVSKTNSSKYYKYTEQSPTESTEVPIPKGSTIVSAAKAVISDNADDNTSLKFGITSVGREPIIRKTLKQGFYINDSINEMLAEFGYDFKSKGKQAESNWSGDDNDTYNPDVRALSVAGKIGIRELFQEFREKSKCKIKFCTFACIRSPAVFVEDSIKTLQFAEAVNSVILAPAAPSSLPAAADTADSTADSTADVRKTRSQLDSTLVPEQHANSWETLSLSKQPTNVRKGGSIRRQRRKKHAIFKTFKKSRLGFSASDSASDSALASDSNSVKVKHKTRNKKKHNTRNNTVKK